MSDRVTLHALHEQCREHAGLAAGQKLDSGHHPWVPDPFHLARDCPVQWVERLAGETTDGFAIVAEDPTLSAADARHVVDRFRARDHKANQKLRAEHDTGAGLDEIGHATGSGHEVHAMHARVLDPAGNVGQAMAKLKVSWRQTPAAHGGHKFLRRADADKVIAACQ